VPLAISSALPVSGMYARTVSRIACEFLTADGALKRPFVRGLATLAVSGKFSFLTIILDIFHVIRWLTINGNDFDEFY
jgi:hypothetical protein